MQLLTGEQAPSHTDDKELKRAAKRAAGYEYTKGVLYRRLKDGSHRICPPPAAREAITTEVHQDNGHWGEKRTAALLSLKYWWRGLYDTVRQVVCSCPQCDRVNRANHVRTPAELMSLPIGGRNYRWGLDFSGPYEETGSGNKYILHMIEHFTKFMINVATPAKESARVAHAFRDMVLAMHGAPAEVLTDQGGEFTGKFEELLEEHMIDHRHTSANHPQGNGLSERSVQTVKGGMQKVCEDPAARADWDLKLYKLSIGYNCSPQAATGFAPAHLMFGTVPALPSEAREKFAEPINLDDPEEASRDLLNRMNAIAQLSVMAGGNLLIAQHRDQLHYARRRGGGLIPRLRRLEPGDYVYIQPANKSGGALDIMWGPAIFRVITVERFGVVRLTDKAGQVFAIRQEHCLRCHLNDIDGAIDYTLVPPKEEKPCELCLSIGENSSMLLCDGCNGGFHLGCLRPPLEAPPEGAWCCPRCTANGVEAKMLTTGANGREIKPQYVSNPELSVTDLHGTHVIIQRKDKYTGLINSQFGKVICRQNSSPDSDSVPRRGRGKSKASPPKLDIVLEDGTVMPNMSVRQVRRHQLPEEMQLPDGARARLYPEEVPKAAAFQPAPGQELADFNYNSRAGVEAALATLMPGPQSSHHVTAIFNRILATTRPVDPELLCVETMISEVKRLLHCVDLSAFSAGLDPWSGTRAIGLTLEQAGIRMVSNDLDATREADFHMDALQPSTYRAISKAVPGSLSLIVTSPWYSFNDLAVPLAAHYAEALACVHVSSNYLASPTSARAAWVHQLAGEGRLHIIKGTETNRRINRKCAWLVIATNRELLQRVIRPEADPVTVSLNFI